MESHNLYVGENPVNVKIENPSVPMLEGGTTLFAKVKNKLYEVNIKGGNRHYQIFTDGFMSAVPCVFDDKDTFLCLIVSYTVGHGYHLHVTIKDDPESMFTKATVETLYRSPEEFFGDNEFYDNEYSVQFVGMFDNAVVLCPVGQWRFTNHYTFRFTYYEADKERAAAVRNEVHCDNFRYTEKGDFFSFTPMIDKNTPFDKEKYYMTEWDARRAVVDTVEVVRNTKEGEEVKPVWRCPVCGGHHIEFGEDSNGGDTYDTENGEILYYTCKDCGTRLAQTYSLWGLSKRTQGQ